MIGVPVFFCWKLKERNISLLLLLEPVPLYKEPSWEQKASCGDKMCFSQLQVSAKRGYFCFQAMNILSNKLYNFYLPTEIM